MEIKNILSYEIYKKIIAVPLEKKNDIYRYEMMNPIKKMGEEFAKMRGYFPVGVPLCVGYICGYYVIKHYLKKTGKTIIEATLTPTEEIIRETEDFWYE